MKRSKRRLKKRIDRMRPDIEILRKLVSEEPQASEAKAVLARMLDIPAEELESLSLKEIRKRYEALLNE
jgi:hypothetical protein